MYLLNEVQNNVENLKNIYMHMYMLMHKLRTNV